MDQSKKVMELRRCAAEHLADAVAFEVGGQSVEALQAFEDALNAERWAVYFEGKHSAKHPGVKR